MKEKKESTDASILNDFPDQNVSPAAGEIKINTTGRSPKEILFLGNLEKLFFQDLVSL